MEESFQEPAKVPLLGGKPRVENPPKESLFAEKCYHGQLTDTEAVDRCTTLSGKKPRPDGSYLVCMVGKDYYLYVCYKKKEQRFKILCDVHVEESTERWKFASEINNTGDFPSLKLLIKDRTTNPLKLKSGQLIKLKRAVLKPDEDQ